MEQAMNTAAFPRSSEMSFSAFYDGGAAGSLALLRADWPMSYFP